MLSHLDSLIVSILLTEGASLKAQSMFSAFVSKVSWTPWKDPMSPPFRGSLEICLMWQPIWWTIRSRPSGFPCRHSDGVTWQRLTLPTLYSLFFNARGIWVDVYTLRPWLSQWSFCEARLLPCLESTRWWVCFFVGWVPVNVHGELHYYPSCVGHEV